MSDRATMTAPTTQEMTMTTTTIRAAADQLIARSAEANTIEIAEYSPELYRALLVDSDDSAEEMYEGSEPGDPARIAMWGHDEDGSPWRVELNCTVAVATAIAAGEAP